jgi:hypothetical protein
MRKFGPKSLLRLTAGTTLLDAQLAAVGRFLPGAQSVVVTGFEAERVHKELPPGVMAVENELYDDFNVGRSLELGGPRLRPPPPPRPVRGPGPGRHLPGGGAAEGLVGLFGAGGQGRGWHQRRPW